MVKGDTFTHQGIEYTVITVLPDGEVEGRAVVHIGAIEASPTTIKSIIIKEVDITP